MLDRTDEELIEYNKKEDSKVYQMFQVLATLTAVSRREILKLVKEFYADYGTDGVITYKEATKYMETGNGTRRKRLLVLYSAINDVFSLLGDRTQIKFEADINEIIEDKLEFLSDDITDKEKQKLANFKWGIDDLIWTTRLENDLKKFMLIIQNEIKVHITSQRKDKELEEMLNKKFDSFDRTLERLLATEATVASVQTAYSVAKKNGYKYYYWVIKPDACYTCIGTSGTFPITAYQVGVTAPPLHPHCRCIIRFIKSKNDKKV